MVSPFVSATWLRHRLLDCLKNIRVVDGSWHGPSSKNNGKKDFERQRIESAVFFDIDEASDKKTDLPHMLPSPEEFAEYVGKLGISNNHHVIVYDNNPEYGVFSSPRVWWTFRVFGHNDISVLDGGLPKWVSHGYPTVSGPSPIPIPLLYKATYQPHLVRTMHQMLDNCKTRAEQVIDARSQGRFVGTSPEPRAGLPSGHMIGAINIPFSKLLNPETGLMAPKHHIQEDPHPSTIMSVSFSHLVFENAGVDLNKPMVASCGSGITACTLALGAAILGKEVPVYDGSWTEWAQKAPKDTCKFGIKS
eukprot:Em0002g95a